MKANSYRRHTTIRRDSGNYWLSFSDMMSVLVLIFIFVVFSMMLSLNKQKDQLAKTEEQYALAMQRMEASELQVQILTNDMANMTLVLQQKDAEIAEQAQLIQSQKQELESTILILTNERDEALNSLSAVNEQLVVLANTKAEMEQQHTVVIQQKDAEISEQAQLIQTQKQEMENAILILNNELDEAQSALNAANAQLLALADSQNQLEQQRLQILALQQQLSDKQSSIVILQAENASQSQELAILGEQNTSLSTQLSEAQQQNAALNQRISMLSGNAKDLQGQIDALLLLIESKEQELATLGIDYKALLAANQNTQSELDTARRTLETQKNQLNTQSGQLSAYEAQLSEYRDELLRTQGQLQQMVGVKAQIVQELSDELKRKNVDVTVDDQTGAIRLPSEMLFSKNSNTLTAEGRRYLDRFLPVYLNVLLSERFKPYIAEIIIEGHTDSSGTYIHNLELSQQRAFSVASYVLDDDYIKDTLRMNTADRTTLKSLITASGRSFSALIYAAGGTEDRTASRRVEIKFRLKDEETVALTEALLNLIGSE